MGALASLDILRQQPLIGLLVFLGVSAGVIFVLSGGRLLAALGNLLRVALTFFTTPFLFLRDALTTIVSASEEEKNYTRTRVFMLFRYSRLQYLGILLFSLVILSGGITAGLVALYPAQEMEQSKQLSDNIKALEASVVDLQTKANAASDPAQKAALEKRRDDAKRAFDQQKRSTEELANTTTLGRQIVEAIQNARSADNVANIMSQVEANLPYCPNGGLWVGFDRNSCSALQPVYAELARRKTAEFQLQTNLDDAANAVETIEASSQQAQADLEQTKSQLDTLKQARSQSSLFNPNVLGSHIGAAIGIIVGTLFAVIVVVWLGAIFIDVMNWLILLMRSAEATNEPVVRQANTARAAEMDEAA